MVGIGQRYVTGKLGTMKKSVEWSIYPHRTGQPVLIQSDKRIARVDLDAKTAVLSDGKGGHPGSHKLSPALGAVTVPVPDDMIARIREVIGGDDGTGVINLFA